MFPFLPSLPNNIEGCGGIAPQQMMLPNLQQQVCNPSSQPNPGSFGNMQQIQPQSHAFHQFQNPHVAAVNNQSMDNVRGSHMVMPNRPQMTPSPSFGCSPNIPFALQTSLGSVQPQQGTPCFHIPQNLNPIFGLPIHGQTYNVPQTFNQLGVSQLGGQFGISGQMQSLNQNFPSPQGQQFWPQNTLQNLNHLTGLPSQTIQTLNQIQQLSQQAAGATQPGLFNAPQASLLGAVGYDSKNAFLPITGLPSQTILTLNQIQQVSQQATGIAQPGIFNTPQASHLAAAGHDSKNAFLPNSSGFGNPLISTVPKKSEGQHQGAFVNQASASQNSGQKSCATMQASPSSFASVSTKQNEKHHAFSSGSVQPRQVGHNNNDKHDISASKFGQFERRSFNNNNHKIVKRDQSEKRFQKPNQHIANEGLFGRTWGKGSQKGRERKPQLEDYGNRRPEKRERRVPALKYTEEEIKQWCEARKRNFPTAANIERKKHPSDKNTEVLNENAKICRQQLKDVLTKQMELGFEAAEIPSHYLSDPESIPRNDKATHMGVRVLDKYGNTGRHGREKWQSKRHKSRPEVSPVAVPSKREPTLLQRLLSSEIKRDRSQLLQALRFMTLNSFFEHWPDKALEYPQVIVKDAGCDVACAKSLQGEGSITSGVGKIFGSDEARGRRAESNADEGDGESADESICTKDGDGPEED